MFLVMFYVVHVYDKMFSVICSFLSFLKFHILCLLMVKCFLKFHILLGFCSLINVLLHLAGCVDLWSKEDRGHGFVVDRVHGCKRQRSRL